MDDMTCAASGEPIPNGAAYITDADGNHYLPEHYPDPNAEPEEDAEPAPTKGRK